MRRFYSRLALYRTRHRYNSERRARRAALKVIDAQHKGLDGAYLELQRCRRISVCRKALLERAEMNVRALKNLLRQILSVIKTAGPAWNGAKEIELAGVSIGVFETRMEKVQ